MIVKVQATLNGRGEGTLLIYDRERAVVWEGRSDAVSRHLRGRPQAYFEAVLVAGDIRIVKETFTRDW